MRISRLTVQFLSRLFWDAVTLSW